ncbi:MAG TPA: hypothetical protein VGP25_08825 [Gemmatimonadaceae bacterium]|jgi:hypothetical protein|nr:hypothetical protein [Gemmatimonadaceae bacterium]
MRFEIITVACAALALAVASTEARADDGRVGRTTSPPTTAYGDGEEAACDLVTRAEASHVVGASLPAGVEKSMTMSVRGSGALRAQYCLYGSELVMGRVALGSSGRTTFGQYRRSLAGTAGFRDVTGIGDEAFAAHGQLNVRRGNTTLIIDVGQSRALPNDLAAERSLAAMAIPRL